MVPNNLCNFSHSMYDTPDKVLIRLLECGITLSKQKRELFINKIEFFGFAFSEKSITCSQTKIENIQNMPPPTIVSELRFIFRYEKLLKSFYTKLFYAGIPFTTTNKEKYSLVVDTQAPD